MCTFYGWYCISLWFNILILSKFTNIFIVWDLTINKWQICLPLQFLELIFPSNKPFPWVIFYQWTTFRQAVSSFCNSFFFFLNKYLPKYFPKFYWRFPEQKDKWLFDISYFFSIILKSQFNRKKRRVCWNCHQRRK